MSHYSELADSKKMVGEMKNSTNTLACDFDQRILNLLVSNTEYDSQSEGNEMGTTGSFQASHRDK